jgi:hypothetical protein
MLIKATILQSYKYCTLFSSPHTSIVDSYFNTRMDVPLVPILSERFTSSYNIQSEPPLFIRDKSHGFLRWRDDPYACLSIELLTPRLDSIHRYLWCAGLPRPARPLHRQQLLGRTFCITQRVEEHLVWHENRIFLKPLPGYLLDIDFWKRQICTSAELHKHAYGFLMSYAWLISCEQDMQIAKEVGLVPHLMDWEPWQKLLENILDPAGSTGQQHVYSQRYNYGELRLSRIELFYRYLPSLFTLRRSDFGFMNSSTWYNAFVDQHFRYLVTVLAYVSIVLSAMQVILASNRSGIDLISESFIYTFATGAILFIFFLAGLFFIISTGLCCYHVISTLYFNRSYRKRQVSRKLESGGDTSAGLKESIITEV